MRNDHRRLVLVVDTNQRFIDDTRPLLAAHRVLTARDLGEAHEIVLGGRVDLVLLGPAFGSDVAISQARTLLAVEQPIQMALAADVVTNRLLKAALKAGFTDVLDTPLAERDLADLIAQLPSSPQAPTEIELVVLPAAATDQPVPDPSREVAPPMLNIHTAPAPQPPPAPATPVDPPVSVVAPQPAPAPTPPSESPVSVATPAEVAFVAESVPPRLSDEVGPAAVPPQAGPLSPPVAVEQSRPAPHPEAPPAWPVEESAGATPESTPPEVQSLKPPVSSAPAPAPEELDQLALLPPHATDILDQVMPPPPPAMPPPTTAPEAPPTVTPEAGPTVTPEAGAPPSETPSRSGPGRVIAVMAGKGGSGKTITATNLAIAIGIRADPERVVIVDADLQFGDVALMLRMDPIRTLDDLVGQVDQMSDEKLDAALLRHESGIRVLPAPLLPILSGEIDAKSVIEVVDRLRSMFDTVIVDTGPVFDDGLITILEHSDQIITVVDMDLPSVKNTKVALDGLRQIGFDMDRIRLVVNRANSKAHFDLVELERSIGLRVGGSIPSDRLIPRSVNEGTPAVVLSPRSRVARAFHALAESLDPGAAHRPVA